MRAVRVAYKGMSVGGEHFSITKNNYWKDYHFDSAIKSYTDWGASIKVAQLESKRESN